MRRPEWSHGWGRKRRPDNRRPGTIYEAMECTGGMGYVEDGR